MTKRRSNFLADVWYELTTKVVWPTWNRMVLATTVVVIFILFWATVLWAFDSAFVSFQGWLVNDDVTRAKWEEIQKQNQPAPAPGEGTNTDGESVPVDTNTPPPAPVQ